METKVCSACGNEKPIDLFAIAGSKKNNFNYTTDNRYKSQCKECCAIYAKEWRKKRKKELGETDYRGSGKITKYPKEDRLLISAIRWRVNDAIGRATRRQGYKRSDLDITADYAYKLFKEQNGRCKYTNAPLSLVKKKPDTLSIDKIDPAKGYIKGNIQWVVWAVNRAKGDLTEEMFINMCKAVAQGATTIPKGSTS